MRPSAALFDKVGQLTRQLNSLQDFRLDPRIPDLATQIPDARSVCYDDMTDKAANRTMGCGRGKSIADRLNDNIQLVMPNWNALMSRISSWVNSRLCAITE
nr:protein phosphatase CheZ [Aeromonas caviae]